MMTSKEMADSVFRIRDACEKKRKKRKLIIMRGSYICSAACITGLAVFGFKNNLFPKPQIPEVQIVESTENNEESCQTTAQAYTTTETALNTDIRTTTAKITTSTETAEVSANTVQNNTLIQISTSVTQILNNTTTESISSIIETTTSETTFSYEFNTVTTTQSYDENNVSYNNTTYSKSNRIISNDSINERIDEYNDKPVYSIKNLNTEIAIAFPCAENDLYYMPNKAYFTDSLKKLTEDTGLEMSEEITIRLNYQNVDTEEYWGMIKDLLISNSENAVYIENLPPVKYNECIYVVNENNISFYISKNGYIFIFVNNSCFCFYVNEEETIKLYENINL